MHKYKYVRSTPTSINSDRWPRFICKRVMIDYFSRMRIFMRICCSNFYDKFNIYIAMQAMRLTHNTFAALPQIHRAYCYGKII